MSWLHIAYDEGGIAAINALHDRHEIPDDINLGFHQMAAGGAAISSGRLLGDTAAVNRGLASSLEGNTTIQQYAFGRDEASWAVVAPVLAPLANAAFTAVGADRGAMLSFPSSLTSRPSALPARPRRPTSVRGRTGTAPSARHGS